MNYNTTNDNFKKSFIIILISSIIISSVFGATMGFLASSLNSGQFNFFGITGKPISGVDKTTNKIIKIEEESAVVNAAEKASPAVVSIIVTKDLPIIEKFYENPFGDDFGGFFNFGMPQYRQRGTEKREVGGGTGFIISDDGHIITNKHVVTDEDAEYTVLMNDENKFEAKILAQDPINDLAILKIEGENFPFVGLGDSSTIKVGQTVIAIGNALGEFRNTVSTGVVSGLARSIVASGSGVDSEQLMGVIQTDASINPGNSGGPLLNLAGQVIGINTAIVQGAQNIGFAIPVNEVKNMVDSVRENGRFIRPWLGVRYVQINKAIAENNNLNVEYGALIVRGEERTDLAIIPGSPADKAGLEENDIILQINGENINSDSPLAKTISKFKPGDEITLNIMHKGDEKEVKIKLEEMK